jgi:hypothetical protein
MPPLRGLEIIFSALPGARRLTPGSYEGSLVKGDGELFEIFLLVLWCRSVARLDDCSLDVPKSAIAVQVLEPCGD